MNDSLGDADRGSQPLASDCRIVELRLQNLDQLFDPLDPSPFHDQDLHRSAEAYIVESAKELPSGVPCELVIHLDASTDVPEDGGAAGDAIRSHFVRRSSLLRRELSQLLRRGVISLGIGLAFLVALFLTSHLAGYLVGESPFAPLLKEGLLIVGWVAMWRPLEIFLYDWWPILAEQRVHDRLSRIRVRIVSRGDRPTAAGTSR